MNSNTPVSEELISKIIAASRNNFRLPNDVYTEVKSLVAQATQEAEKRVNDQWLNQSANDHDERIRADERSKIYKELRPKMDRLERLTGMLPQKGNN